MEEWPLQDRVQFLPWIAETFKYATQADDGKRSLFVQQKFVRDYLQHGSPYRGLYLRHQLGVGKTCAAIATAEALRSTASSIVVMTTKMLRRNFADEVPACTSPELLRNQQWSFDDMTKTWHPDEKTGINYDSLAPTSQGQIDRQIDMLISKKFKFVHYNGLSKEKIKAMLEGPTNPFDGAVVIIDEVHNFISRVMNKRLVAPIYDKLLDAVDCKIILLSGTPIVNRVAELAYIVNLVQGKTLVHVFKLKSSSTQEDVEDIFKDLKYVDVAKYEPDTRSLKVIFAPNGFELTGPGSVKRVKDSPRNIDALENLLRGRGIATISRATHTALPLPDDVDVFDKMFVDWERCMITNPMLLQRRMVGAISSFNRLDPAMFATVSHINIVHADLSPLQFVKYALLRHEERRRERNVQRLKARVAGKQRAGEDNLGQVYRTFSLALCTFAFPEEIVRPFKFQMRLDGAHELDIDKEYDDALSSAVKRIKAEMPDCLRRSANLMLHSPKFAAILDRIDASPGPALVYSQFRRAEGVGLLSATLDLNGWSEFRLQKNRDAWVYGQTPIVGKRYMILRTEEDEECNRLMLHIFNNELSELPSVTRASLPASGNLHGEIATVLMITASGAEGISLKNVRQVHMLEPFWNHVRLDQVIGRAVRAKSHMGLPEVERHVDVFLYLANFTSIQREDHAIMRQDKGLTSDQYVHGVAMKKKLLTDQALGLINAASVDCMVHAMNPDEASLCLRPPKVIDIHARYRTALFNEDHDDAAYAKRTTKLAPVEVAGTKYYLDTESGVLYDYEKLRGDNVLVQVGQV